MKKTPDAQRRNKRIYIALLVILIGCFFLGEIVVAPYLLKQSEMTYDLWPLYVYNMLRPIGMVAILLALLSGATFKSEKLVINNKMQKGCLLCSVVLFAISYAGLFLYYWAWLPNILNIIFGSLIKHPFLWIIPSALLTYGIFNYMPSGKQ